MSGQQGEGPENRLAQEISPYLLMHRHNPVDWYAWGPEAFERARREGKPIFLSVGYSTCYWCHVMERESFSDPETAEVMNRLCINIKVDREERPELDEIYMAATQLLSRQGGWPNSLFLTPQLRPFYAGTYFPLEPRPGLSSFRMVLEGLGRAWEERRDDVELQAAEVAKTMRQFLEEKGAPAEEVPAAAVAERSLDALGKQFDSRWGGFGSAPKFPTPGNLFLLAELASEKPEASRMLIGTLDQMARGGIYDQLAGGFHRYSTDREWKVPHFEKMLYDNGLLLEIYADEHQRTGDPELARVVAETAAFIDRELGAPEGGFWSAIDAEVAGHEGGHHAWRKEELEEVLGQEDCAFLAPIYGYDGRAFFEGAYVLHLPVPMPLQAERRKMNRDELWQRVRPLRQALLKARLTREMPLVDDKVLTDWNGLAIAGLALAGQALGEPRWLRRAAEGADFVLRHLRDGEGTLLHCWRRGEARIPAFLGDYVFFVHGLLALHATTGEVRWLDLAGRLTRQQIERLGDADGGFFVAAESEDVLFRSKEVSDGALPSGNAMAVLNLLDLSLADPTGDWLKRAAASLRAFGSMIETQPDAARMLSLAVRRYHKLAGAGSAANPSAIDLDEESAKCVTAELILGESGKGEEFVPFRLRLEVAAGWHIYGNPAESEQVLATELTASAELRRLSYPEGEIRRQAGGEGVRIYQGRFAISGEVRVEPGAHLRLFFSPCDASRCLPATTLEIPLEIPHSGKL